MFLRHFQILIIIIIIIYIYIYIYIHRQVNVDSVSISSLSISNPVPNVMNQAKKKLVSMANFLWSNGHISSIRQTA